MYRIPVEESFSWQRRVLSFVDALPGAPTKGDRHILNAPDNRIITYIGTTTGWIYDTPEVGWALFNAENNEKYVFNGLSWNSYADGLDITESLDDVDIRIADMLEQASLAFTDELLNGFVRKQFVINTLDLYNQVADLTSNITGLAPGLYRLSLYAITVTPDAGAGLLTFGALWQDINGIQGNANAVDLTALGQNTVSMLMYNVIDTIQLFTSASGPYGAAVYELHGSLERLS